MLPIPSPLTCLSVVLRRSGGSTRIALLRIGPRGRPGPWVSLASSCFPSPGMGHGGEPCNEVPNLRSAFSVVTVFASFFSLLSYYFFLLSCSPQGVREGVG